MSHHIDSMIDSGQSYAYATLRRHGDYGHMDIKIRFEAASSWSRNDGSIKVTCQIGSFGDDRVAYEQCQKPYAVSYGYSNSDPATLAQLETGIKVMRKIERYLAKISDQLGEPSDYAELCQRIIVGSGCAALIAEPGDGWINGGPMREKEMLSIGNASARKLKKMEAALVAGFAKTKRPQLETQE